MLLPTYTPKETLNEKILRTLYALPDKTRKEVRLLSKQFHILSVESEDNFNTIEVTYKQFNDDKTEFKRTYHCK